MKKRLLPVIMLLFALLSIISCDSSLIEMEEGNVNYYIYPYLNFTLSEERTYFIASVVKGAKLKHVSIPGYIHTDFGPMPVKEFAGFEDIDDSVNLEDVTLDVNVEKVRDGAFDKAENFKMVKSSGESENPKWAYLPTLNKNGYHFLGWKAGDSFIYSGMPIDPENKEAVPVFGSHVYTYYEGKEPTCTENGYQPYGVCDICGYSTYQVIPELGHSLVHHDSVPATCTESGTRDYYECTRCHIYFSDENAENQITDIVIPALGHSLIHVEGKDPTCQTEGVIEHWYCEVCRNAYSDSEGHSLLSTTVIDRVDHQPEDGWSHNSEDHWKKCRWCSFEFYKSAHDFDAGEITRSATLHQKGEKKFTCNTCSYEKYVDIPEHDHVAGETEVVEPTCFTEGYTLETCALSECGEVIRTNVVPALTHEGTEYERLEPTCMTEGHISYYHCDVCGHNFESQSSKTILPSIKIDKVPHRAGSALYHDDDNHWNLCIYGCGTRMNSESHAFDQRVTASKFKVSDRNCTQPDIYRYSCICSLAGGGTFTVGEPLGHNITLHQRETNATCTEPGYHEYWYCERCKLYFTDSAFTTTGTLSNLTKAPLGHNYQWVNTDPSQHWRKCTRCGDIIADSYGSHTYEPHDGTTSCTVCGYVVVTGEGGFTPIVVDKRPMAHLTYVNTGTVFTFTLHDDKPENPPTGIEWYLDGRLTEETGWSFTFNAPYPMTYKVMCLYSNDYGRGSETIVVNGG